MAYEDHERTGKIARSTGEGDTRRSRAVQTKATREDSAHAQVTHKDRAAQANPAYAMRTKQTYVAQAKPAKPNNLGRKIWN